ncbi:MAG: hypothetical protein AAF430_07685 [Myxococcota bacterium]
MTRSTSILDRLELRVERLRLTFRLTYAFHAREVRFECDRGEGFERVFPETFSFHIARHDPAELFLQLVDLSENPRLLAPGARKRDTELLVSRLVLALPRYLEGVLDRLETDERLDPKRLENVYADMALLSELVVRFADERLHTEQPGLQLSVFHLRKLLYRGLDALVRRRVSAETLQGYVSGALDPVDPADDLSEAGFAHALESDDTETRERILLRLSERAFYRWLDEVCLDESNGAFESENSPFASRETEVMAVIHREGGDVVERGRDLTPYLRRRGNRDVVRLLGRLEAWFLRQYDIHHAASMIQHADHIANRRDDTDSVLSRHRTRSYVAVLTAIVGPFALAAFFYDEAPRFFDWLSAVQIGVTSLLVGWFLFYRFLWKRDLTLFHASVPRIMAGIIVGYLPIFFIDEVWSLAARPWPTLLLIVVLLGTTTLLYIYIEVQRRLGESQAAIARARQIFLLGVLQASGIGVILTGVIGRFMAARNWQGGDAEMSVESLRAAADPFIGQLPVALGVEPLYVFPSAVMMMAFMSFFIGTFLQLMWEELPITEPL